MTPAWYVVRFTVPTSPLIHVLWRAHHNSTVFFGCHASGTLRPCLYAPVITCIECMARWLPLPLMCWVSPLPVITGSMS